MSPVYLPNRQEIEERKKTLRWLQLHGFPNRFIASIMQKESPPIVLVRSTVRRYKYRKLYLYIIGQHLQRNEYD